MFKQTRMLVLLQWSFCGITSNSDSPMCCSMRVLSVRGIFFLPFSLVCPLFRISSRTDFKLGNLLLINCKMFKTPVFIKCTSLGFSTKEVECFSPPGHIRLHYFHPLHSGLVYFDKGAAENLSQSQHLDHLHDFGTDTFDPVYKITKVTFTCTKFIPLTPNTQLVRTLGVTEKIKTTHWNLMFPKTIQAPFFRFFFRLFMLLIRWVDNGWSRKHLCFTKSRRPHFWGNLFIQSYIMNFTDCDLQLYFVWNYR